MEQRSDASAPTLVRRMVRKRQNSPCSFDQRLTVVGRPWRMATVLREKKSHNRRQNLVKDGQRLKHSEQRPRCGCGCGVAICGRQ